MCYYINVHFQDQRIKGLVCLAPRTGSTVAIGTTNFSAATFDITTPEDDREQRFLSYPERPKLFGAASSLLFSMQTVSHSLRVKWPRRVAGYSSPSNAEISDVKLCCHSPIRLYCILFYQLRR